MNEPVILLEDDDRFRVVVLERPHIATIIERCHQPDLTMVETTWRNHGDERALTGQRIFRRVVPAH